MIPLHPKVLHFPIALLITALLTALLAIFFRNKRDFFKEMLMWITLLAGLSAIVTATAGFIAESQLVHNDTIHEMLELHKTLALTLTAGLIIASVWIIWRRNKMQIKELIIFTVFLAVLGGLVGYTAEMGGKMVYEQGAGIIPMQEILEKTPHQHYDTKDHSHEAIEHKPNVMDSLHQEHSELMDSLHEEHSNESHEHEHSH